MEAASDVLSEFEIPHEVRIISAHRTPDAMYDYGKTASDRGLEVIIAGAGGAAHLPGMLASLTPLPVVGVPVVLKHLDGMDSMMSIVQMPRGTPVATVGTGNASNAAHLALRILGTSRPELRKAIVEFKRGRAEDVRAQDEATRSSAKSGG